MIKQYIWGMKVLQQNKIMFLDHQKVTKVENALFYSDETGLC